MKLLRDKKEIGSAHEAKLLFDLRFIENYCLRRIPRLVSLVRTTTLSQILSDHVSMIMDRLDLLDDIFSLYPASGRNLYNPSTNNSKIFLEKDDHSNQRLINNLLEVSHYRLDLYGSLVIAMKNHPQASTNTAFKLIFNQEEKFYEDLITCTPSINQLEALLNLNGELITNQSIS